MMSEQPGERVIGRCNAEVARIVRRTLSDLARFERGEGPEVPSDDWTSDEEDLYLKSSEEEEESSQAINTDDEAADGRKEESSPQEEEEESSQGPEESSQAIKSINVVDDEAADGGSRKEESSPQESSQAAPDVAVDDDSRGRAPRTRSRGHNRGTPPARSRSPRRPSPRRSRRRLPPGVYEFYPQSLHMEYIHRSPRRRLQAGEAAEDDTDPYPAIRPSGHTVQLPESFFRAEREGRRFEPHTDWTYVGRNSTGGGAENLFGGPRMYLVPFSRVFLVDRETIGERHPCIDLLRCEQSVESGCPAFGYKLAGVIFTYGQHTHD